MTTRDTMYAKLKARFGVTSLSEGLIAWWANRGGGGFPAGQALYNAYDSGEMAFADREEDFWSTYLGGGAVSARAEAMWLAAAYDKTRHGPWLKDLSGNGHHLRLGSSGAAWVLDGALQLPGAGVNYASTPDDNSLDTTGAIEIQVKMAFDSFTADQRIVSKWGGGDSSYLLMYSANSLILYLSPDGTNNSAGQTVATIPSLIALGQPKWIKVTRSAATADVKFYLSDDGVTWSQVATNTDTTGTISIHAGTQPLRIGIDGDNLNPTAGRIYRVIVKNGGTTVFDADFSGLEDGTASFTEATGKTVTVTSAAHADTNDPKFLSFSGTKYLYVPGATGNYAWVPDAAALDITGDITVDAHVEPDSWRPSTNGSFINKNAADQSFDFLVDPSGRLVLYWTVDNAAWQYVQSSVAVPANTADLRVRASMDVDDGLGNHVVKFFTSTDGVTWTQFGSTQTVAGTTSIFSGTSPVQIGASNSGGSNNLQPGKFYRARLYNGFFDGTTQAGSLVLDVDFNLATEPYATFTAVTGQTVTIGRAASGRKAALVDRPTFLFGTDDYMEAADHPDLDFAAADSFSIATAFRHFATSPNGPQLSKKNSGAIGSVGWQQLWGSDGSSYFQTANGSAAVADTRANAAEGVAHPIVAVRNVAAGTMESYVDGATDGPSTVAMQNTTNAEPVRVGAFSGAANSTDMEWFGSGIWREALPSADVTTLNAEFGTNA